MVNELKKKIDDFFKNNKNVKFLTLKLTIFQEMNDFFLELEVGSKKSKNLDELIDFINDSLGLNELVFIIEKNSSFEFIREDKYELEGENHIFFKIHSPLFIEERQKLKRELIKKSDDDKPDQDLLKWLKKN